MSAPNPNFEFLLKKKALGLYSDNKPQSKDTLKPQDVISSVFKQLKAIQVADTLKSSKCATKDFQKFKKSNFLCVNNLPVYDEVPKTSTKFETQCVSDTELINIIEDAEIVDDHQGMTQEFETSFVHHTEKHSFGDAENIKIEDERKITEDLLTVGSDKENMNKIHRNIAEANSSKNCLKNDAEAETSVSLISPIMCSNNVIDEGTSINTQYSKNDENTQLDEYSQIFHDCIDYKEDLDKSIERPLSPIFMHKSLKSKSKTPSPLIFNLEKFEQFEMIAVPILEANDLKSAKHVINSQILDKELHFQMDEQILLNKRNILSPVIQNKKEHIPNSDLDTDLELIELDRATSEDLINKIINDDSKVRPESEVLKDEILFSSDEEDYVHKSLQDLPFTCALETSFYDQSDVLDKTMYVGFQTASNKSIQIFTESFAQAKSILSGEITVTDMVNICESSAKNKTQNDDGDQVKMDSDLEDTEFNLAQKEIDAVQCDNNDAEKHDTLRIKTNNFEGFMTASNKVIKLSQKALARCNRVFQDIDLNCNFDTQIEEAAIEEEVESCNNILPPVTGPLNKDISEEDVQNIDDEIIQEFENIEMSLKEDKESDKHMADVGLKSTDNKDIEIIDTMSTNSKEVFKDTDFEEDLIDLHLKENSLKENILPTIMKDPKLNDINLGGFKTASNKNITISKDAIDKTKNIFQDLGSTKFPNKSIKNDKEYPNSTDVHQPSTSMESFVGFKTANNKNIEISKQAFAKTENIFKNIDKTELPKKNKKDIQKNTFEEVYDQPSIRDVHSADFKLFAKKNTDPTEICPEQSECFIDFNQPSTSKSNFVGFKTANNKNIKISDIALARTKNIFKDIDSSDFKYPDKTNKIDDRNTNEAGEKSETIITSSICRVFKTANNKDIKVSDTALAKTKHVFKDLDSDDFKLSSKLKDVIEESDDKSFCGIGMIDLPSLNMPSTSTGRFGGFMTANNKKINVTKEALAKMKNIFQGIDDKDIKFPGKRSGSEQDVAKTDDKKIIYESEDFNHLSTSKTRFMGFKTANNNSISISKKSLAKTKVIFKDIDAMDYEALVKENKYLEKGNIVQNKINEREASTDGTDMTDFKQPSTNKFAFVGFKTANNKKITISEESLTKTKHIFKEIDETDITCPEKTIFTGNVEKENVGKSVSKPEIVHLNRPPTSKASVLGFLTGNNKKIHISKESLAVTKNIFKDIDSNDFVYPNKSNKQLKDTIKEKTTLNPGLNDLIQTSTDKTNFIGFKTGNNKVINVSETALAKTRNIFKDLDATEFQIPEKLKEVYPNIEVKDIEHDFEIVETAVPKFQGFQTANNKQIKVSDVALVESRKLFQDIGFSQDIKTDNKLIGKDVLDKDKNPLLVYKIIDERRPEDTDDINLDGKSSPVFKGFQTANKKPVKISEEALAKSRKIFQDIETIADEPEPEFHGFKTGDDEEIEVSQKALIQTKKFLEAVIERSVFQGFQTANDKTVEISEDSLTKSKKLIQDIEKDENLQPDNRKKTPNIKFGFKTGSNREVTVSDEAVVRSKRRFSEIDDSNEDRIKKKDKINEDTISGLIDTQVLNNFDKSLHTEDFHDSPIKSKRSGSPILSCPRAKKRKKFETPYSQNLPTIKKKDTNKTTKDTNKLMFDENYKKEKKYTLKDMAELTRHFNTKIDPYILQFTFDNILKFEFGKNRNEISNENMTTQLLKETFLNSINSKLVPNGWVENHLKLILWKLISYEIKFKCLVVSTKNVMNQLKYRYDKELYNAQRPALRKILEKDDVASRTIVLCVAGIYVDGVSVASATTTDNLELLLTDGWYCIRATIDKMLAQLVCQGKIVVGSKIVTTGAELVNCEQGISPLEDISAIRFKLFGNSTRRARWDARLGYHGNAAILSRLSSVKIDGGKVSKLRVFVTRVYPALYVEKFEDGSTVTRSERLEHLHQMKSEAERQAIMEKIYEEVEKEFSDQESQDSESLTELSKKRTCLDTGSQIAKVMKRSKDPAEFTAGLTTSQTHLLEQHTSKHRELLLQDIQEKIRYKVEKAGVCVNTNVVTLLKIRVAGVGRSGGEITKGMISIWKPPEAVLEIIKEGACIDVMNVVPTAIRYSEIQMSAGRQSIFNTSKYKEPENFKTYTKLLKRVCYTIKELCQNPSMSTDYNEIDTVGFIFLIEPTIREFDSNKQPFQNVFLADADKNMICVNFWGGLKKFGYHNVLDTGQVISCANLQKRAGNTRKSIPQYRVTEFSYFTKTPKNENARNLVNDLSKIFSSLDRRKFCDDCTVLKNNFAVIRNNAENISPYRFNNSDYNMSKNKIFIDSPLLRPNKMDDNFNLTGLDFESTFKQTDTQNLSEEVLQRKKKVNEKIARLKMYGEPPPLSTIHIINKSKNASSSYKSPLNSNNNNSKIISQKSKSESTKPISKFDSSVNVASVEETPEKCVNLNVSDVACSPVLMNRTYVKSVNPVKINFDVKDNNDSNMDHFAEEFDGSPPLSLD